MKKALVVVDFQKDFIDGALGSAAAAALRPIIEEKLKKAVAENTDIIFTLDTHGTDYLETNEGLHLPVEHCIYGSEGWCLDACIEPFISPNTEIIMKSSFMGMELGSELKKHKYESVELCGLTTSVCVINNALLAKAILPEAQIIVDRKATADSNEDAKEAAFKVMKACQIEVV